MSCPHCSKVKSPFCPECGAEIPQISAEQKLAETLGKVYPTMTVATAAKVRDNFTDDEIVTTLSMLNLIKESL